MKLLNYIYGVPNCLKNEKDVTRSVTQADKLTIPVTWMHIYVCVCVCFEIKHHMKHKSLSITDFLLGLLYIDSNIHSTSIYKTLIIYCVE